MSTRNWALTFRKKHAAIHSIMNTFSSIRESSLENFASIWRFARAL